MSIQNRQAQAKLQPPPLEHLEALTEYPWDDEESLNELHEAVIVKSTYDNRGSGAPNKQAGVYSESANDAALKFGIRLPPNFKISSDANVSHYLYKKIMKWGPAAQYDNYDFIPKHSSQNEQVKYIEN